MGNSRRSPTFLALDDVPAHPNSDLSAFSNHHHFGRGGGGGFGRGLDHKWTTVIGSDAKSGGNMEDKYLIGRFLGLGESGVTYLCVDRDTQERFACKTIRKSKLRTLVDVEDVRREVAIMRHVPRSPCLVGLREVHEDDRAVHLVMDLCEGGELFDRIVARGYYSEREAKPVIRTIVEVVQLCHKHGVMHRDLKPENFLFVDDKENSPLKAIDFGLSIFFKPGERFSEIVGSPCYMAPEVLKRNYGPEIDIWSAGVILYILLCGVPPFWADTQQRAAQDILRGAIDFECKPWPSVSESAKDLVRGMMEPDPKLRLTANQILEHPWLQDSKKVSDIPLGEVIKLRLKDFSSMNRFKRRALRVIADHLSVEEVEDVKKMFKMMDTDSDNIVSHDELKAGLAKFDSHLTDSQIQMLIESVDADGKGTLGYADFIVISLHLQSILNDEHLRKAFSIFDKDGNGFIEREELCKALAEDGTCDDNQEETNDILQQIDTDKDEQIGYNEFVLMMRTVTDWRKA